jgi:glycine betaine/proline transport system permease protein
VSGTATAAVPDAATANPSERRRPPRWAFAVAAAVVVCVAGFVAFQMSTLPQHGNSASWVFFAHIRDWIDTNRNSNPLFVFFLNYISNDVGYLMQGLQSVLEALGWPGVLAAAFGFGWVLGGWRLAVTGLVGFVLLGVLDLWTESMDTVALTVAAVLLSLVIGLPLGIWAGRSERVRSAITPVLDVMQIMPAFTYLAPMALVFSIGNPSSTITTMIYAIPVAVRIAALAIRQVPTTAVEASESLGATRWQNLLKVRLPLARRTLALAVNQTIMMALSMVVITALINADGLGKNIVLGLSNSDVGTAFQAGIAVVIVAMLMDRFTRGRAKRTDKHVPASRRAPLWIGALVLTAAGAAYAATLPRSDEFAESWQVSLVQPVNDIVDWIKDVWFPVTNALKNAVSYGMLNPLQDTLTSVPWWLVVALLVGLAWQLASWRAALTTLVCMCGVAALGLWQLGMQTLVTVLIGAILTMVVGIALGIGAGRSNTFEAVLRPILDIAQTMPSFVYLLPALALFGPSRFTAIIASIVYAAPPVVRLVSDGIRGVSPTVVEAARSAGSTRRQLLWKVQMPMARRSLMLAANQGIVMVLAMVVVGGLVGAQGLGYGVVSGFVKPENFGMGVAAGIAIVLLGITLDRITQGAGLHRKEATST